MSIHTTYSHDRRTPTRLKPRRHRIPTLRTTSEGFAITAETTSKTIPNPVFNGRLATALQGALTELEEEGDGDESL